MSFSRQACRHTVQKRGSAQLNHLWISDDCLAQTFARFVGCTQRRHGSNVPGPLEARRRLNRRRNMNLARAGAGSAPDVALLFGAGKKRSPNLEPIAPTSLPTVSPPPPTPPRPPAQFNSEQELASRLPGASTVNDIKNIVTDLDLDLDAQPSLSVTLFEHILLTRRRDGNSESVPDIHTFLLDSSLNTPSARNFAGLVGSLVDYETEMEVIKKHMDLLGRVITSGSVCHDELVTILKRIPDIKIPGGGTLDESDPHRLGLFFEMLWNAAVACPTFRPVYQKNTDFSVWLDILLAKTPTAVSLSVAKDILSFNPRSRMPAYHCTQYVLQVLRLAANNGHVPLGFTHSNDDRPVRYLEDIMSLGEMMAPSLLATCISKVTETLVFAPKYGTIRAEGLLIWAWILQRMKLAPRLLKEMRALKDLRRQNIVGNNVFNMSQNEKCMLRLWLVATLGVHTAQSEPSRRRRRDIFTVLLAYFRGSGPEGDRDVLSRLADFLLDLRELGLPNTQPVLTTAAKLEYRQIVDQPGDLPTRITQLVNLIEPEHITISNILVQFQGYTGRRALPQYAPHPYIFKMAQSIEITSPEFIEEILQHVETPSPRRAILLNIIRHHVGAKIALSLAHRTTSKAATQGPKEMNRFPKSDESGRGSWAADGRFIPDPTACLDTFHTLALIFAFSPELRPEVAWRLSFWCYQFLKKHDAPLRPIMVRSLHYAGVVRYREEKRRVAGERHQFVVRLARQIEGREVAAKLRRR